MTLMASFSLGVDTPQSSERVILHIFLNQKVCCGYSKELSQRDGSFEHQKHMFTLTDREKNHNFYAKNFGI